MATLIDLSFNPLASDYCLVSLQEYAADIASGLTGSIAGDASLFVISAATPAVDDENKLWQKLNADGTPEKIYRFTSGQWLSENVEGPTGEARRIYVGTTDQLKTYDGGSDTTVTPATGPMWEVDTSMAALIPMGAGTTSNGTVVTVGNTGGDDEVTLTEAQLAPHAHGTTPGDINSLNGEGVFTNSSPLPGQNVVGTDGTDKGTFGPTPSAGDGEAHNNLPPYTGVYFIKRTARQFYVG